MAKIDPMIICREYYEDVKHLYPELNFKEFAEIAYTPWVYTRKHMGSGELHNIRLKYFGLFWVSPKRVKGNLKKLEERFAKGLIGEKRYGEIKIAINNYLQRNENI